MNLSDTFTSGFQDIISHPLRSIMTLVAIVIGIFAVVVMFSSVYGIKMIISDNMKDMGFDNSIRIYPSQPYARRRGLAGARGGHVATPRQSKPLDYDDYLSLRQNVEHKFLYGIIESWYGRSSLTGDERIQIIATNSDFFRTNDFYVTQGRTFSSFEIHRNAKVCLLGSNLVDKYFQDKDPLGQNIEVGGNVFVVIGVLNIASKGGGIIDFGSWERSRRLNAVYIPLTTGIAYLKDNKSVDYLVIQSEDSESYADMMNRTRQVLLANRNMSHDFTFHDIGAFMAEMTEEMDEFMQKWNITLTAIASISLLVGGLGLFSTMLISIGERLMEIGIRKSVGASPKSIFFQFLFQSLLFALISSAIGILLSTALIKILSIALDVSFPVVIEGILLGIGFSVVIGLLSGLYPAIKAAEINPIQAIYYNE